MTLSALHPLNSIAHSDVQHANERNNKTDGQSCRKHAVDIARFVYGGRKSLDNCKKCHAECGKQHDC